MKHTVQFLSCVLSQTTDTDAEGRWKDSDRVRWVDGYPEKIGGWEQLKLASGVNAQVRGICRGLHNWSDLGGQDWAAIGTHKTLSVYSNGVLSDITPIRVTHTNIANAISTSNVGAYDPAAGGDAKYVKITDAGHGASVGDIVNVAQAAAVGGITPNGDYEIRTVIDVNNYVIRHTVAATSTVANGGGAATDFVYYLAAGRESAAVGTGYGLGSWNVGAYGTPRSGSSQITQPRTWSLDDWGEDLLANPAGGGLYLWDRSVGVGTRAALIGAAPAQIDRMRVSHDDRHVVAFGCTNLSAVFDPLQVRWSSDEDYTAWTPTETNTAGGKRLQGGSRIVAVVGTAYGTLIFTDTHLHVMQFIGQPDVFSIRAVANEVRLAGPNCAIEVSGVVYAMGLSHFYKIEGGIVSPLPCEIRDKVFLDTQPTQGYQVFASYLEDYGEVRWDYPSATSEQNSKYAVFNINEPGWYGGTLARSAMGDKVSLFSNSPFALDCNGVGISDDNLSNIWVHETGTDDGVNPMNEFMESFDWQLPDATAFIHLGAIYPDFKNLQGAVDFTVRYKSRPHKPYKQKLYPGVTSSTAKVSTRVRGQQIAWRVGSSALGTFWRMGMPEVEFEADGSQP